MSNIKTLAELADAAKSAADRASESIDDALSFVEESNLRIATMEKGMRTGIAKGKFEVPDGIDANNAEIAGHL